MNRDSATDLYRQARECWRSGEMGQAEKLYRAAIGADATYSLPYYDLAMLLEKSQPNEAASLGAMFISLAAGDPAAAEMVSDTATRLKELTASLGASAPHGGHARKEVKPATLRLQLVKRPLAERPSIALDTTTYVGRFGRTDKMQTTVEPGHHTIHVFSEMKARQRATMMKWLVGRDPHIEFDVREGGTVSILVESQFTGWRCSRVG